MKRRNKKYLADIELGENGKANPVILRIILGDDCTQIDFGYAALSIYQKGGWIRISPETFIQVHGSEKRYPLQHAKNIALAPNKIEFESTQDWRVFSLFFEPIPMKDCVIDLVEELKPSPHDFNYYGIEVKTSTAVLLEDALL
jgi:hypothetical protein